MMIYAQDGRALINGAKVDFFDVLKSAAKPSVYANFAGGEALIIGCYASLDEANAALHRINAAIIRKDHTFLMPRYGFFTEEAREKI